MDKSIPPASADKTLFNAVWKASNPRVAYQVYVLADEQGEVIYVGMTSNLRQRVYDHWKKQPWGREIAYIEVVDVVQGSYSGLIAEKRVIQSLRPKYNKYT